MRKWKTYKAYAAGVTTRFILRLMEIEELKTEVVKLMEEEKIPSSNLPIRLNSLEECGKLQDILRI